MPGFGIGASLSNYGTRARSPSLTAFGQDEQAQAMDELGQAASEEAKRNAENTMLHAQAKQGGMQLGATGGALLGFMYGGPVGAVVGGLLGGLAGKGLF